MTLSQRAALGSGAPVEKNFGQRSGWRGGQVDSGQVENSTSKPRLKLGIVGRVVGESLLHVALEPHE